MQMRCRSIIVWLIVLLSLVLACPSMAPADEPAPSGQADLTSEVDKLFAAWNRTDSPG
jgi:hypothetical protein